MLEPFRFRLRVRYGECDAQGVVFNARFADYVDLSMTEFLRGLGYNYATLLERGLDTQVVKLTLEWQGPAHYDDIIESRVRTTRVGNTSFVLEHQMVRAADAAPLCRAEAVNVMVSSRVHEKTRVPDDLRAALEKGAPGVLVDHSGG